jgi:CheY-like chemotaxis protein
MGRVLIVDDNQDTRDMLARVVTSCRHEVETAGDGEEAIAAATERPPGLVVLDLMMPGINGFDVLRSLRADPRTRVVPVVVYSALSDSEFVEQALSLGANDYWVKGSFDVSQLERWLDHYLTQGKT